MDEADDVKPEADAGVYEGDDIEADEDTGVDYSLGDTGESVAEDKFDDQDDGVAPISALPPQLNVRDEIGQMEVSASPAFQCLDDLFLQGKLTGTKTALLKAKYMELHDMLMTSRQKESEYLQLGKQLQTKMDQQKTELEKADQFPENSNTEVSKLREQLLNYNNQLAETDEMNYQLQYKLERLQEEKDIIEREYSRIPKSSDVEKRIEELKHSCTETQREIGQRESEIRRLKDELDERVRVIQHNAKDIEKTAEDIDELKTDLVKINSVPSHMAKDNDRTARHKYEVEKELTAITSQVQQYKKEMLRLQTRLEVVEKERDVTERQLDEREKDKNKQNKSYFDQLKDFDHAKEREAMLLGDKATLDMQLKHLDGEKKSDHESYIKNMREKDIQLRNLKKAEIQRRITEDSLEQVMLARDKVEGLVDALPNNEEQMKQKRQTLANEVQQIKRTVLQQNSFTGAEAAKVEQCIAEEERLLYELSDLRIEVVELTRLAAIKTDEREQKSRDFRKAEERHTEKVEELKIKELQIAEQRKKHGEMLVKLKDFAKLYDVIKNERNKCVGLIQMSYQKGAEMREKIKILQNESEILRNASGLKSESLNKTKLQLMAAILLRDTARNELCKQNEVMSKMADEEADKKMKTAQLSSHINQLEEEMVALRKRYETEVQLRNDRGVQLVERNEELCVYYERLNVLDQALKTGMLELSAREEQIKFLKTQQIEDKRQVELLKKRVPGKRSLERELATLQIQVSQCEDLMVDLEKRLEDPNDASRIRFLEGKDLAPVELQTKIEETELHLALKEEQLLEKDLILDQVTRLASRIEQKAETGREDTLALAKNVNELQSRIKAVTRAMMAKVSELSMQQASAVRLQQQVKDSESELERCYMRLEKGEAPSEETEREWLRQVRDEWRRQRDSEVAIVVRDDEEQRTMPNGTLTTAELRPNAYIPGEEGELPIPRPYGQHAPFKPSETGSTMRHFRKPQPKPIEI